MKNCVHHEGLADGKNREPVSVDGVDLPRDHQIAGHRNDQQVHPGVQRHPSCENKSGRAVLPRPRQENGRKRPNAPAEANPPFGSGDYFRAELSSNQGLLLSSGPEGCLSAFTTAPKNTGSSTTVDPVGFGRALNTAITTFSFRLMYRCCPKIPRASNAPSCTSSPFGNVHHK